ncbi:FecR protein domain protein [Rhodopirellula maiorica SM1]|uniref:FecR protein domain protein n=1 Tax=Rhodopirellula maiorica SM1 TaxID=1265738 RepID=M5RY64_9BACT|nr:DNRLRE domain-containing protein [Rhodopirellula maiorica]EMI20327.1 FecR protein domain protein [Rhodopirellula maiorica SM1]
MTKDSWGEYKRLRDAALDGRIAEEEVKLLESFVLDHDAMRRDYAEHAHQQASLKWNAISSLGSPLGQTVQPTESQRDLLVQEKRSWRRSVAYVLSLATAVLVTLGFAGLLAKDDSASQFAMITSSEACRWGECTVATSEGQPIGAGRLRLKNGIATLRFPNVNVTLEGRVDLQIVDEDECLLYGGRVVANVEQGGEGFVIRTPTAIFIDRGTTFGVNVAPSGTSDLSVFKGRVDVNHLQTREETSVRENERIRASADSLAPVGPDNSISPPKASGVGVPVHISTAFGDGDDAYVAAGDVAPSKPSEIALLVKKPAKSNPGQWYAPWRRKAFMRFDLSTVKEAEILSAALQLQGVYTNRGFATMMPDARFAVYGVTDESQDEWSSADIDWLNSPANDGDQLMVDQDSVVLLGRFTVPQSNPEGSFEISGDALVEFLSNDENAKVTMILIPETVGDAGESYVHGFASKRHPNLPAPTLRLSVK